MIWPFRRKPAPPPRAVRRHVGPTSVDWIPGDIAECIWPGPWHDETGEIPGPALGSQTMVVEVFLGQCLAGEPVMSFSLRLLGMRKARGWDCRCFRKVVLSETAADRKVAKRAPIRRKVDA